MVAVKNRICGFATTGTVNKVIVEAKELGSKLYERGKQKVKEKYEEIPGSLREGIETGKIDEEKLRGDITDFAQRMAGQTNNPTPPKTTHESDTSFRKYSGAKAADKVVSKVASTLGAKASALAENVLNETLGLTNGNGALEAYVESLGFVGLGAFHFKLGTKFTFDLCVLEQEKSKLSFDVWSEFALPLLYNGDSERRHGLGLEHDYWRGELDSDASLSVKTNFDIIDAPGMDTSWQITSGLSIDF